MPSCSYVSFDRNSVTIPRESMHHTSSMFLSLLNIKKLLSVFVSTQILFRQKVQTFVFPAYGWKRSHFRPALIAWRCLLHSRSCVAWALSLGPSFQEIWPRAKCSQSGGVRVWTLWISHTRRVKGWQLAKSDNLFEVNTPGVTLTRGHPTSGVFIIIHIQPLRVFIILDATRQKHTILNYSNYSSACYSTVIS